MLRSIVYFSVSRKTGYAAKYPYITVLGR